MRGRILLDLFMRGAKPAQQHVARITRAVVVDILNGFYRETAGFLSAFIPAHAVSDEGEPAFLLEVRVVVRFPVREKVLVVLALAANVRQAGHFDAWPNVHYASLEGLPYAS